MLHLTELKITLPQRLTKVIISYGLAANFLHSLYKGHRFINNAHRLCKGARETVGHMLQDCKELKRENDKRDTKGRSRRSRVDAYGSGKEKKRSPR